MNSPIYNKGKTIHCLDTNEVVTGDKYLSSKHWKLMRQKAYKYFGGKCQRCGDYISPNIANVHHRIYKRLGNENITDLILYCDHCHACIHSGRSHTHVINGDLQTLLFKFLTPTERQETFEWIIDHFNLDIDMIEQEKERQKQKGREKALKKKQRKSQKSTTNKRKSQTKTTQETPTQRRVRVC